MAIGERIHFFRLLRGMTQKYLGTAVGFPEKSADVRLAQYETGTRTPKADLTAALAQVLDVSPQALSVPDIDSNLGFIHTLFAVEDLHGVRVKKTKTKYISSLTVISRMLIVLFSKCSPLGQSKPKNTETAKSQKNNTMSGVIHFLNKIPLSVGRKFPHRN